MKLLERFKAWRVQRQETVIAKATLLGMKTEYHDFTRRPVSSRTILAIHQSRAGFGLDGVYLAYAPVHGGAGEVPVTGRTLYQCAKRWMKTQELT